MSMFEDEPRIVTTDPADVQAIFETLYVIGALDDADIYEIVKPDGTTERLHLGGGLQGFADPIIKGAYPGCEVTLLSSGETS